MRAIAVDWSGRRQGERAAIRIAEAADGILARVEGGFDRAEVVAHLIAEAQRDPGLVVGLDFSFSLPAWFVESLGLEGGPELWDEAARSGEDWLAACEPPFWGLPGRRRPPEDPARPQLRRTDVETAAIAVPGGLAPRSPFQVSGAGSVGASTVRGLPHLAALRDAGLRVWPWDALEPPAVVEIWTRVAIGATVKSDPLARLEAARRSPGIPAALEPAVAETEDSFDAAMTAVWLSKNVGRAIGSPRSTDPIDLLEGRTWLPRG